MGAITKAEFYKLTKFPEVRVIFSLAFLAGLLQGLSPYAGFQVYKVALYPGILDAVLISVFTVSFVCVEFGNAVLTGASRARILSAKLAAYFSGLFILLLLPLFVSVSAASIRHGFDAGDVSVLPILSQLLFYILYRFFLAGLSVLVAVSIRNPLGTFGASAAGIYLVTLLYNPMENLIMGATWFSVILGIIIFLSLSFSVFMRRDI